MISALCTAIERFSVEVDALGRAAVREPYTRRTSSQQRKHAAATADVAAATRAVVASLATLTQALQRLAECP